MRAFLLAAGEGRRLRPLTLHQPKPLLTIGGETLIERQIRALAAAGIREIGINLHHLGDRIERYLGTGRRWGAELRYFREQELLDTGGALRNAAGWLGTEPFALVAADVYTDYSFRLPDLGDADAHLLVVPNPPHNPEGDFALSGTGMLSREGAREFTYSGIAVVHPRFVGHERRRVFPLRDCMFSAAAAGRLAGSALQGIWSDVGTVQRLEACRQLAAETRADDRDQA